MKLAKCKSCGKVSIPYINGIKVSKYCMSCKPKKDIIWKPKKSSIEKKNQIIELDSCWSREVRSRDNFCRLTGLGFGSCGIYLEAHHIEKRDYFNTRWLLENGILLCEVHHTASNIMSAHGTPNKFRELLRDILGVEMVEKLHSIATSKEVNLKQINFNTREKLFNQDYLKTLIKW